MPKRLQLSRRRGWKKPPGAVVVSRPTRWGNPYRAKPIIPGAAITLDQARGVVDRYRNALVRGDLGVTVGDVRDQLRGKDLLCWCPPGQACHADVLIEVANG